MKIITDINECNKLIENHKNSIFDSYGYKKILNSYYNPDAYLFFVDGKDVIPLVVKNNLVTFFGGAKHNHANTLPNNKTLLNSMLSYLKKEDYRFQLTAINKDYFDLLDESNQYLDVLYPAEWHYKQIQDYDIKNIFEVSSRNMRTRLNRMGRITQDYTFTTLTFIEFKEQFSVLIKKHISYFSDRGKETFWKGNEDFLLNLLTYFNKEENLLVRIIKLKQEIVGISILVYNNEEMIYYFSSPFKKDDQYITQIIYLADLKIAKQISTGTKISQFNALRGTYTNKKRFGFKPIPLYALVKDDRWIVQADSENDPKSYESIYGKSNRSRIEQVQPANNNLS